MNCHFVISYQLNIVLLMVILSVPWCASGWNRVKLPEKEAILPYPFCETQDESKQRKFSGTLTTNY